MPCKQSNTYIICFEIWARVKPGYNPQNLGNKSVTEKLLAIALNIVAQVVQAEIEAGLVCKIRIQQNQSI